MTHTDAEVSLPERVATERLVEIVAECLNRWAAYPTIPGSLRWQRNGMVALRQLEYRLSRAADSQERSA